MEYLRKFPEEGKELVRMGEGAADLLHYEGNLLEDIDDSDPVAITQFDFEDGSTYHLKLVCENEIVVLYIDEAKALSSRITHSIDGAHIGVFSDDCSAKFSNITMQLPN